MGVYIPGMEMPKSCNVCPFMFHERRQPEVWCTLIEDNWLDLRETLCDDRHQNCPFVEIPRHGRLIDADALAERFWDGQCYFTEAIKSKLQTAPTIIPTDTPEEE